MSDMNVSATLTLDTSIFDSQLDKSAARLRSVTSQLIRQMDDTADRISYLTESCRVKLNVLEKELEKVQQRTALVAGQINAARAAESAFQQEFTSRRYLP